MRRQNFAVPIYTIVEYLMNREAVMMGTWE
jgi:hypothetical protein